LRFISQLIDQLFPKKQEVHGEMLTGHQCALILKEQPGEELC